MKISYHKDTDSLYIHLSDVLTAESEEVADDTVLHFDEDGNVTGMEIYGEASEKVDLSMVDVVGLVRRAPSVKTPSSSHHGWVWLGKTDKPPAASSEISSVNVGMPMGFTAIKSRVFERYKSDIYRDATRKLENNNNLDQRPV